MDGTSWRWNTEDLPTVVASSASSIHRVIDKISKVTHLDRYKVEMEIVRQKYGEIGGMYNIKSHKLCQAAALYTYQGGPLTLLRPVSHTENQTRTNTTKNSSKEPGKKTIGRVTPQASYDTTERHHVLEDKWRKKSPLPDTSNEYSESKSASFESKISTKNRNASNVPSATCETHFPPRAEQRQRLANDSHIERMLLANRILHRSANIAQRQQLPRPFIPQTNIPLLRSTATTSVSQSRPSCLETNVLLRNPIKRWSQMHEKREAIWQQRRSSTSVPHNDEKVMPIMTSSTSKSCYPSPSQSNAAIGGIHRSAVTKPELHRDILKGIPSIAISIRNKVIPSYDRITSGQLLRSCISNRSISKTRDKVL